MAQRSGEAMEAESTRETVYLFILVIRRCSVAIFLDGDTSRNWHARAFTRLSISMHISNRNRMQMSGELSAGGHV